MAGTVADPAPGGARQRAEQDQRRASDPGASVFVSAAAGSGKTKLLTDRLLRLMLSGARPDRIQCLTFTKAAAAEMALRLQARLGEWVTMSEPMLDDALRGLDIPPDDTTRRRARSLFAEVLDLPGGMRIGTIHAFCQSLLRRFPLEAALSPHFQLVDEADATLALDEAREAMLAAADTATQTRLQPLAGLTTATGFGEIVAQLARYQPMLDDVLRLGPEGLQQALRRVLCIEAEDEAALLRTAVSPPLDQLAAALRLAEEGGSDAVKRRAHSMLDWLALPPAKRATAWNDWVSHLLTQEGKPRVTNAFFNKKLTDAYPDITTLVAQEQDRVLRLEDDRRALRVAEATAALLFLAMPVLADYRARKQRGGLLDYEDLIGHTNALLQEPGAAWVLYKLDGGLDHLLLDEVQDTSDPQWRIAAALTAEFFAGAGARDSARSFFAVGDPKQSIYSFQGADPAAFTHWRGRLQTLAQEGSQRWEDVPLNVSFRSTAPVLALVDKVFADLDAARGVVTEGPLRHFPNRSGQAGSVELWPLAPPPDAEDREAWTVPERNLGLSSAPQILADGLADWIRAQTDGSVMLESRGRPVRPGDVLILVRRRGVLDRALVRALKARGVPVAGLDRMQLTEQPAVQDLLALLDTLLLPQDDLTLAAMLVSPLGGLSDDSMMQLAMDRDGDAPGSLWAALQSRATERADWRAAHDFLSVLRTRADFVTPHALLTEALGPLGARARLLARLGPDAAEPVDELLAAALRYTRAHPASLQGFLQWLRQSAAEVKREAEAAQHGGVGEVRIMTVHGAKGLQAPLVILPDTTSLPPDDGPLVWVQDNQTGIRLPLWSPRVELRCKAVNEARRQGRAARMEEHNRLLYVALTRAEDRLLVCGWQPRNTADNACWYRMVERGFAALEAETLPFQTGWGGESRRFAAPQTAPPAPAPPPASTAATALPAWAGGAPSWTPLPPPEEPDLPSPLAPSRPEGVELGPVPHAASPLLSLPRQRATQRGTQMHALLQHLPDLPPPQRDAAARRYLSGQDMDATEIDTMCAEAMAVLNNPALLPLFGADSQAEVPISGVIGNRVVSGVIDRIAVRADGIWLLDYKSNRNPPRDAASTPQAYLRQMAAYRAVLRAIYPGRPIHAALIWTQNARLISLPDTLLDPHEPTRLPPLLDPPAPPPQFEPSSNEDSP